MKFKSLIVTGFFLILGQLVMAQTPTVQALVPDRNYETEVLALINHAETSIDLIQSQFFAETQSPQRILQALIDRRAKDPKLKIRVLLEMTGNLRNFPTEEKLKEAGIEVFQSFAGSVRGSAVCVDQRRVLVGSTKMTKSSIGKNNEMNALIESESIGKAFTEYFDQVSKDPSQAVSLRVSDGNTTFITDATYIDEVLSLIKSATDSLDVSMYMFRVTKDKDGKVKEIFDALVEAQQKRNVKIRILLEQGGKQGQKITDANKEVQRLLKASGVNAVYLVQDTENRSRSRYIIKDQKEILLGTGGWYSGELEARNLNLRIENPDLAKRLSIYYSQKIAYEGARDPVPPPRRFWIGFRRPDVSPEDFAKGINERLITDTQVGAERGLIGYTPTLLEGLSSNPDLPQEIAMVTYKDDEDYRAIRETPEGTAYGNLHWNFFAKELPSGLKSGSAVATAYQGQMTFGSAYYLSKGITSFQAGEWSYAALARKPGEGDPEFLNRAKNYVEKLYQVFSSRGLDDFTFRIEKNFIFEYHLWASDSSYVAAKSDLGQFRLQNGFGVLGSDVLSKGNFGYTHIGSGQGSNLQFKTEIESPEKIYSPLREKFLSPISKEPVRIDKFKMRDDDFSRLINSCRERVGKIMKGMK